MSRLENPYLLFKCCLSCSLAVTKHCNLDSSKLNVPVFCCNGKIVNDFFNWFVIFLSETRKKYSYNFTKEDT